MILYDGRAEAEGVGQYEGHVADISVAVPGLRVGGVDGSKAGGVGRGPAALIGVLFTEKEIVEAGGGVLVLAGK